MKKNNSRGFTLIELLAVITIMGILMIVAIPAVTRTIENSRKDTFVNTVQNYVSGLKTMWASDNLSCIDFHNTSEQFVSSAVSAGFYYVEVDSSSTSVPQLLESGGKSSWGSRHIKGYILVHVYDSVAPGPDGKLSGTDCGASGTTDCSLDNVTTRKTDFYPVMSDDIHGVNVDASDANTHPGDNLKKSENLKRGDLHMTGVKYGKTGWSGSILTPPRYWSTSTDASGQTVYSYPAGSAKRCVEQ